MAIKHVSLFYLSKLIPSPLHIVPVNTSETTHIIDMAFIYDPSIVLLLLLPILHAIYLAKNASYKEQQIRCQEVNDYSPFEATQTTQDQISPSSSSSSSPATSPHPYQPFWTGALWRLTPSCSSSEPLSPIDLPEVFDLKSIYPYTPQSRAASAPSDLSKVHSYKAADEKGGSSFEEDARVVQGCGYEWAAGNMTCGPRRRVLRVVNPDVPIKRRDSWTRRQSKALFRGRRLESVLED